MADGILHVVGATHGLPYRRICSLSIGEADKLPTIATGWFFGDRLVLTAKHVFRLYEHPTVSIWPGRHDANDTFFGRWNSIAIYKSENDYAGIVLPQPVGQSVGTFGIAPVETAVLDRDVVVVGYGETDDGHAQYSGTGGVVADDAGAFNYRILTVAGQSGSPVWLNGDPDHVVGIHVRERQALRLTEPIVAELLDWRARSLAPG